MKPPQMFSQVPCEKQVLPLLLCLHPDQSPDPPVMGWVQKVPPTFANNVTCLLPLLGKVIFNLGSDLGSP